MTTLTFRVDKEEKKQLRLGTEYDSVRQGGKVVQPFTYQLPLRLVKPEVHAPRGAALARLRARKYAESGARSAGVELVRIHPDGCDEGSQTAQGILGLCFRILSPSRQTNGTSRVAPNSANFL